MLYKNTLSPIFWWPIIYLVTCPKFLIPVFRVHSIFKVFIKISLFFSFWCVPTYALGHSVHLHLPRSVYLCYVFPEPYFLIDKDRHLLVCSRRVDDGILLYYFAQNIGVLLAVEENVPKTFSGYFHIIRMLNEDPSISFLLKDREVTLLPLHHRERFRKKRFWLFLFSTLLYLICWSLQNLLLLTSTCLLSSIWQSLFLASLIASSEAVTLKKFPSWPSRNIIEAGESLMAGCGVSW